MKTKHQKSGLRHVSSFLPDVLGIEITSETEKPDLKIGSWAGHETESDPLWWKDRVGRKLANSVETHTQPAGGAEQGDPNPT
jgi:hypothetical protein